jgi:hypothetical protein
VICGPNSLEESKPLKKRRWARLQDFGRLPMWIQSDVTPNGQIPNHPVKMKIDVWIWRKFAFDFEQTAKMVNQKRVIETE